LHSLTYAGLIFGFMLASFLVGMRIARRLPEMHVSGDSKDSLKQGLGLIATLTALVLGLLVASTKGAFDSQSASIKELAANVSLLDRMLSRYGPETKDARASLVAVVELMLSQVWPDDHSVPANLTSGELRVVGDALFDKIVALEPKTEVQRLFKTRALEITVSLAQTRQRLLAQKESSVPIPFLFVLGFWLAILFGCNGMLAPRNLTVVAVQIICMLSVSGALFLVLEMDKPFDGAIRVSGAPIRAALGRLGE